MAKLHISQDLFDLIYPVGSIYLSVNNTDPSTLFGGTWSQIKGRYLLGTGVPDANTDNTHGALTDGQDQWEFTAGTMLGEYSHRITIDEMPKHAHDVLKSGVNYSDLVLMAASHNPWGRAYNASGQGDWIWSHGVPPQGGNAYHNNMPTSLVVYMWKRIR